MPDEQHETAGTPANPTRTASDTSTHANTRRASEKCADVRDRAGVGLNARASEAHAKTTLPAITLVGYDGGGVRVGLNHLRHLVVLFL